MSEHCALTRVKSQIFTNVEGKKDLSPTLRMLGEYEMRKTESTSFSELETIMNDDDEPEKRVVTIMP